MEIKIISINGELYGVQKTELGNFNDYHERYPYLGGGREGEIVSARLVYQANYPGNQWADMPDHIAEYSDREVRRVYFDSNNVNY